MTVTVKKGYAIVAPDVDPYVIEGDPVGLTHMLAVSEQKARSCMAHAVYTLPAKIYYHNGKVAGHEIEYEGALFLSK